jgi:uncharacterized protein YbdZ (MbtH family)
MPNSGILVISGARNRMTSAEHPQFYRVVTNDDGCYCIWPIEAPLPPGWAPTGFSSGGYVALSHVAELWRTAITELDRRQMP